MAVVKEYTDGSAPRRAVQPVVARTLALMLSGSLITGIMTPVLNRPVLRMTCK